MAQDFRGTRSARAAQKAQAEKAQPGRYPSSRRAGSQRTPPRARTWWVAGVVLIVAAAGAAWWTIAARPQAASVPMLGEKLPDQGYDHVPVGTQVQYRTSPPASGPHYPSPVPAGVYPNGLPVGFWVHNLEHGYVVLLYRPPLPDALLMQFREMVQDFPKSKWRNVKLVVAPYEQMIHPFALLGWDWRMWMDSFDRAQVLQFYTQRVDKGREDIP